MARQRNSIWAQEVQYSEVSEFRENIDLKQDLLIEAYEALNRFCQKEQKRSKNPKRRKHCWQ